MPRETYVQLAVREFRRTKALADGAMSQVNPAQFFATPAETDNSIAIVVKHVSSNLLSRWTDFLTSDGEKPDRDRDRVRSFDERLVQAAPDVVLSRVIGRFVSGVVQRGQGLVVLLSAAEVVRVRKVERATESGGSPVVSGPQA